MDKDDRTPEEKIYFYVNKTKLNQNEKKDFFHQLTLLDWNQTIEDYGEGFNDRVIQMILNENIDDLENISDIIELYNNPYGIYTLEFADVIARVYRENKIRFIKGLNLVKDEAINIVYAFRLKRVFVDDLENKMDEEEILKSNILSEEEKETAKRFFKMYETICST
ncbi:MAG: hypothetical protein GX320_04635 [Tissierellia bacterium]|nr:hypothetical protein [Tissierellia bacterium]